ncbi:cytoplasmic protein [Desulfococcus sp.]|uniref:cytoplasmic protein n=1 Tax=Desulfococcus sp. TaxID=2025834 RepID=UPI003593D7AF
MEKKEIIRRNPLKMMGYPSEDVLPEGGFGALMARAGVGKTAFLVQIAIDKLLRDKNVLHISIDEPVEKVCLWYEQVFRSIADSNRIKHLDPFWEVILPRRFIMTFKVDGFSVPKLEERITDLSEQGIFFPQMILIDGLPFEERGRKTFVDLKAVARNLGVPIWFTVKTHRHEAPGHGGMPIPLSNIEDLFDVAIELQPEGKDIFVRAIKGGPPESEVKELALDPSTMMIKNPDGDAVPASADRKAQ